MADTNETNSQGREAQGLNKPLLHVVSPTQKAQTPTGDLEERLDSAGKSEGRSATEEAGLTYTQEQINQRFGIIPPYLRDQPSKLRTFDDFAKTFHEFEAVLKENYLNRNFRNLDAGLREPLLEMKRFVEDSGKLDEENKPTHPIRLNYSLEYSGKKAYFHFVITSPDIHDANALHGLLGILFNYDQDREMHAMFGDPYHEVIHASAKRGNTRVRTIYRLQTNYFSIPQDNGVQIIKAISHDMTHGTGQGFRHARSGLLDLSEVYGMLELLDRLEFEDLVYDSHMEAHPILSPKKRFRKQPKENILLAGQEVAKLWNDRTKGEDQMDLFYNRAASIGHPPSFSNMYSAVRDPRNTQSQLYGTRGPDSNSYTVRAPPVKDGSVKLDKPVNPQ